SSRIRLARNLSGIPFPHFMSDADAAKVMCSVKTAVENEELIRQVGTLEFNDLTELTATERQILVEKHLISPHHAESTKSRAVILAPDESVSIMINEEDHLRIQYLQPGLELEETWKQADKIDDLLEQTLDYSFSEKRGYLTACPTNVGTGLRASVMLHLPGLVVSKQIGQIVGAISQLGLAVRGYYGEGTEAYGNLFQISNQVTLGQTEPEIVENLLSVTNQIVNQERSSREIIFRDNRLLLEDRIYRAIGIMRYARMITSQEALKNISDMRLGIELGLLKGLTFERINELVIITRPAFLVKKAGQELESEERDVLRANIIRENLSDIKI
ncbi:MAG TPA: protein arginine kinase, partial [Desulfobacteria bacterium]|nr:protein arginine kinase [Desulfobacteria bacterium]